MSKARECARAGNYRMAAAEAAPSRLFVTVYNTLTGPGTRLSREYSTGYWKVETPHHDEPKLLRRPQDALRLTHIGETPHRRVYEKYTTRVDKPRDGDVVVDVGAFIGEFCWSVADLHDVEKIVAVEPDPVNARLLRENVPECVEAIQMAANHQGGTEDFNAAVDGAESSLLEPDEGDYETLTVKVSCLGALVDEADFVKIDAEGSEPEVIKGMCGLRPRTIAIDSSPERNGKSPWVECKKVLESKGYEWSLGRGILWGYSGD